MREGTDSSSPVCADEPYSRSWLISVVIARDLCVNGQHGILSEKNLTEVICT
ncbi:hypothetical protein ACQX0Q_02540 [Corynebacterium diphtheriae]